MVTLANLMSHLTNGKVQASDPVEKVLYRQIRKVTLDTPLSRVSKFLETDHFVLIVHTQKQCKHNIMIAILILAFNSIPHKIILLQTTVQILLRTANLLLELSHPLIC